MKNDVFESTTTRIRQFRINKNYSQDYIAQKLGITQKAYSKIENNETKLNVETLIRLAEVLEIPIKQFFDNSEKPVLNDFSSSRQGDNVIYKNFSSQKIEDLYIKLLEAKDEIIKKQDDEIQLLKKNKV